MREIYKLKLDDPQIKDYSYTRHSRKLAETKKIVDYVIEPDLSTINSLDHKKIDQVIEIGYKQAKRDIEKWKW